MESRKMVQKNLFAMHKYSHSHREQMYECQEGKSRQDKLGDWD